MLRASDVHRSKDDPDGEYWCVHQQSREAVLKSRFDNPDILGIIMAMAGYANDQ